MSAEPDAGVAGVEESELGVGDEELDAGGGAAEEGSGLVLLPLPC